MNLETLPHEAQLVIPLSAAIITALIFGLIAHRLRQSPIVGYLMAGMAIGPFTPGFHVDRDQIAVLAEVGVIFLMFALGIEFSIKELLRMKGPAIIGTVVQVASIIVAGTILGQVSGWPIETSIFFGGIICVSSTMIILKNLMNRGEIAARHGRLMLAMLIVQDLAVVILILTLPLLAGHTEGAIYQLAVVLVKALLFIAFTLYLGARVVPRIMGRVEELRSSELFLLTAVVLALGSASISALLGLTLSLGAFMAGLMLTETEFDHRVIAEMIPMRDLFATLFFVSVGMLIDLGFILSHIPAVFGLALFIMVAKALLTTLSLWPFKLGSKTVAFAALGMISIGEFNFVLAQIGYREGVISRDLYNLILSASLITILLTPAGFWIAPRASRLLSKLPFMDPSHPVGLVGSDEDAAKLHEHAIVVGYGRVGQRMTRGLRQAGFAVVVIEQDLNLVRELTASGISTVYGDAASDIVLEAAHTKTARVVVVALPDFGATRAVVHRVRRTNDEVLIVARAQRAENDVKLRDAGATAVVVPEMAGALMLLDETLLLLGLPHDHYFSSLPVVPPAAEATSEPDTFGGAEAAATAAAPS